MKVCITCNKRKKNHLFVFSYKMNRFGGIRTKVSEFVCKSCRKKLTSRQVSDIVKNHKYKTDPAYRQKILAAVVKSHQNNPESHKRSVMTQKMKYRILVLNHYGAFCHAQEYGLSDKPCYKTNLTLEHLNNDGAEHRARLKDHYAAVYRDVVKSGYPDTFTILCVAHNTERYQKTKEKKECQT